jgi:hypothetical protein
MDADPLHPLALGRLTVHALTLKENPPPKNHAKGARRVDALQRNKKDVKSTIVAFRAF